jgi:MFS family permease
MVEADPDPRRKSARNIYVFGFTSLFNDTASEMAYWVLPAFLASIGAGPAQLGVIEGIAESVASLVQLFSGYLADRISRRKPIVVGGYFVANLVKPLLALVTSWGQVLAIRFADRFSKGIRSAPRDVMVAESSSRLGSAYGLIQAMDSAGAVLGPLAALFLLPLYGLRGVFWGAAVPGFLCFIIALVGIKEVPKARAARLAPPSAAPGEPPAGELGGWKGLAILPGASTMFCLPSPYFLWAIPVTCFWCCEPKVSAFRSAALPCSDWYSTSPIRCFPGPRETSATAFPAGRSPPPGIWYSRLCISSLPLPLPPPRSGLRWHPMACSTH